ncbi:MAG: phosphonate C-P lyase system protein PhnH [Egibacteraceae bacterium]
MTARLGHHASQQVFRELLGVLARPGTLGRLGAMAPHPALLVPLALADVDVGVAVLDHRAGQSDEWERLVCKATGARRMSLDRAEIVVALRSITPGEVRSLRRGRADAPERGARLVVACDRIAKDGGDVAVELAGPGVAGTTRLGLDGVPADAILALAQVNAGFPAGVDTFLVAAGGAVAGLPRSTRVTILHSEERQWATRR